MPAHVSYVKPMQGVVPIVSAIPSSSELVADGATGSALSSQGDIAAVTAINAVYITFGTSPSLPSATNGHYLPAGQTRDFGNVPSGSRMRVVAA